ncbi:uncharacterized protein LOC124147907 [Haliotis rufescens]|uniref:uncharacterized protein LOC124147907 n=1 Tax=Haliotis rufescens TaxID=6454 RepID=UPI00201FABD8|nr:uncharacterized protein LOC124147907 [Haliotis rufescens]
MLLLASCVLIVSFAAPSEGGVNCELADLERLLRRIDSQLHIVQLASLHECTPCHDPKCDKPCIASIVKEDLVADVEDLNLSLRGVIEESISCAEGATVFISDCQVSTVWRFNPNEVPQTLHRNRRSTLETAELSTISFPTPIREFVIDANLATVTFDYFVASPFQMFCANLDGQNSRLVADASDFLSPTFVVPGIAYYEAGDELIVPVLYPDPTITNQIMAFNRMDSAMRVIAPFTGTPGKIVVNEGTVYLVTGMEIGVVDASASGGILFTFLTHTGGDIKAFDVLPGGTILFMDEPGQLFSFDPSSTEITHLHTSPIGAGGAAIDIEFNECDELVYIVYRSNDRIELFEVDGTLVKTLRNPGGSLVCPSIGFVPPPPQTVDL